MTSVLYDEEGNEGIVRYDTSTDVYQVGPALLKKYLKYDKKNRLWYAHPYDTLRFMEESEDILSLRCLPYVKQQLRDNAYPKLALNKTRRSFKKDLLRSSPLGDFQVNGIKHILTYDYGILNYDTGTGKTYTALSGVEQLRIQGFTQKLIIIAIGAVLYNWKRELLMFTTIPEEKIKIVTSKPQDKEPFQDSYDVLIMKYSTFRALSVYWEKKTKKKPASKPQKCPLPLTKWSDDITCILDEVHNIANSKSLQSHFIQIASSHFKKRYVLTATLFANGFYSVYSILNFLDPSIVLNKSYTDWTAQVYELGTVHNTRFGLGKPKPEMQEFYEKRMAPFWLKAKKSEVLDLPPYTKRNIYVEMPSKMLDFYQFITTGVLLKVQEECGFMDLSKIKNNLIYTLQALTDPLLVLSKFQYDWDFKLKSHPKVEILQSIIDNHLSTDSKTKFLIWGDYPDFLNRLGKVFSKYHPLVMHGQSTPKGEDQDRYRQGVIDLFRTSDKHQILIANPSVIGTGQNIEFANVAVNWSKDFSFVKYEQRSGRNYRATSTEEVFEYNLIFANTQEELVEKALLYKAGLNDLVKKFKTFTKEQYKQFFNGSIDIKELL